MNKKTQNPDISTKNTKEQILSAYKDVVSQLEAKQISDPLSEKRKTQEVATVNKASQNNIESIVTSLASLKINLNKHIDSLNESLSAEFNKLSEIRDAIDIEQKHLQELYGINETAKTLSALILAQQEQKEKFDQKMLEEQEAFEHETAMKKASWKQQEEYLSAEYKELKEKLEKSRKREEEEYKYNLELARRKEMDTYAAQKAALEKDLEKLRLEWKEREAILKAKEKEFADFKQRVENFPAELEKAKEQAEIALHAKLELQYKYTSDLLSKEVEGERKLSEHRIADLEKKIKEQDQFIAQLTHKADTASNQIQVIACRALDTSAQRFMPPAAAYQEEKQSRSSDK